MIKGAQKSRIFLEVVIDLRKRSHLCLETNIGETTALKKLFFFKKDIFMFVSTP